MKKFRTSSIYTLLFAFALILLSFFGTQGKAKAATASVAEGEKRVPEQAQSLTAAEVELERSLDLFFQERENSISREQLREVQIFNRKGRRVKRFAVANGQVPTRKLPQGAALLMQTDGVAYYMAQ